MIQNIVFDLGRVLVDFDPESYLRSFGYDDALVRTLMQTVFGAEWPKYDCGDYGSVGELRDALCRKYPQYDAVFRQVLQPDWVRIHTLKRETAEYLLALKQRGYRIFLLSNLARESYDYISQFDFFGAIDGGVFSYREHVCKPEAAIYRTLLSRYGLRAEETVFLDDAPQNVKAAQRLGIHGIVFETLPAAKEQLERLLQQ